jgi:hypothetical protein
MTDTNSISTEPRNKSYDKNIGIHELEISFNNSSNTRPRAQVVPKICFNQNCSNEGNNWINIIGRYAGYIDHEVPYWICNDCNSFLRSRRELMDHLVNVMQDYGKIQKVGADIKTHDPATTSGITVTTKDLSELIFSTQMELEEDSDQNSEITSVIKVEPFKPKGCYSLHCNNEGTHRIDILNATTLLADHEIPYFICDNCYAFFGNRRESPLVFPSLGTLFDMESERGKVVSGINPFTSKEVITTKDLHSLLESTRPRQKVEE